MKDFLARSELLEGLPEAAVSRLAEIAQTRSLRAGEYLFLLGDIADREFIVHTGKLEICMPLMFPDAMKDVIVDSLLPGRSLGWSALVKPYRFTRSARAAEPSEVIFFLRQELQRIFDEDPRIGLAISMRIAEVIGHRLLEMQALWVRELQRAVASGLTTHLISEESVKANEEHSD